MGLAAAILSGGPRLRRRAATKLSVYRCSVVAESALGSSGLREMFDCFGRGAREDALFEGGEAWGCDAGGDRPALKTLKHDREALKAKRPLLPTGAAPPSTESPTDDARKEGLEAKRPSARNAEKGGRREWTAAAVDGLWSSGPFEFRRGRFGRRADRRPRLPGAADKEWGVPRG